MKKMIITALVALNGCSAIKHYENTYENFKNITKDVCIDNSQEVTLAQHLYNEMFLPLRGANKELIYE